MGLSIENDTVSSAGRAAHDVGLAALLGGNLFGRLAMNPALGRVSDPSERGEVVNAAWRRYGTVNSLGLAALLAGWYGARATETQPRFLNDREKSLAKAKDIAVGAVAVTGVAAAVEGVGDAVGGDAPKRGAAQARAERAEPGVDRVRGRAGLDQRSAGAVQLPPAGEAPRAEAQLVAQQRGQTL